MELNVVLFVCVGLILLEGMYCLYDHYCMFHLWLCNWNIYWSFSPWPLSSGVHRVFYTVRCSWFLQVVLSMSLKALFVRVHF